MNTGPLSFTEAVRKADIPYAKLLDRGKGKQTRARVVKDIPKAKLLKPAPGTETPSMRMDREAAQAADQGWEDWEEIADEPMTDEERAVFKRAQAAMRERHLTFTSAVMVEGIFGAIKGALKKIVGGGGGGKALAGRIEKQRDWWLQRGVSPQLFNYVVEQAKANNIKVVKRGVDMMEKQVMAQLRR